MQSGSRIVCRDLSERSGGQTHGVDVGAGSSDLGLGGQQRCEAKVAEGWSLLGRVCLGMLDRIGDQGCRHGRKALLEAEQRQTGLGRPDELMGLKVGGLRAVEIAADPPDIAQLDQRPSELTAHPGAELVIRPKRLRLGCLSRS